MEEEYLFEFQATHNAPDATREHPSPNPSSQPATALFTFHQIVACIFRDRGHNLLHGKKTPNRRTSNRKHQRWKDAYS
jgi:hypothetical protein